jgi:tRNA pseudouridine13 synthase
MIEESWLEAALGPPRAFGAAPVRGVLRETPEDFSVDEDLGFEPDGVGSHVLLRVRKRGANTEWLAGQLARLAHCRTGDVGYAGLKDRNAVAVQWFSVPAGALGASQWVGQHGEGFEVLAAHAHGRKLPRGALAGNGFRIRIRRLAGDESALRARLALIARCGVPNYFGPQRFGRQGANLGRLHGQLRGSHRGILLSSARSLVFNAVLAERVRDSSWQELHAGDVANLDGRGSIFPVPETTAELTARCERLEIHPTGPLWGRGEPPVTGEPLLREQRIAAAFAVPCRITADAGMRQERRSLRLAVRSLSYEIGADEALLEFRLDRGAFATAVLRELVADPESRSTAHDE